MAAELDRDLTDTEHWKRSLARSLERRAAAAERSLELPGRELSVAALVALAGGPVAGVAVGKALEDDGGRTAFAGAGQGMPTGAVADEGPASVRVVTERRRRKPPAVRPATERAPASVGVRATTSTAQVTRSAARSGGVADLQRALGVPADGDFGRDTERALKRWQRRHGLDPDGIAGPTTRAALGLGEGQILKRKRPQRARRSRGDGPRARLASRRRGGGVEALQRALGIPADGVFGPATERSLKRWQRAHGLGADGIVGPQTRAKLGLGPGPVLRRRSRGHRRSGGGSGGGRSSVVARVTAAANRIASKPYRYGGGHGSFTDSGYDCSGSVSYALHGGGLLSSPLDSRGFMSYGRPGPGRRITIYANPGHVYMTIDGRRFDTSARRESGSRWSGRPRAGGGYVARHPPGL